MSLARRLLYASVILALLVTATFAALIVAVSSLREANDREARATEAVTATLRLEKTRARPRVRPARVRAHGAAGLPRALLHRRASSCPHSSGSSRRPRPRIPSSSVVRGRSSR